MHVKKFYPHGMYVDTKLSTALLHRRVYKVTAKLCLGRKYPQDVGVSDEAGFQGSNDAVGIEPWGAYPQRCITHVDGLSNKNLGSSRR